MDAVRPRRGVHSPTRMRRCGHRLTSSLSRDVTHGVNTLASDRVRCMIMNMNADGCCGVSATPAPYHKCHNLLSYLVNYCSTEEQNVTVYVFYSCYIFKKIFNVLYFPNAFISPIAMEYSMGHIMNTFIRQSGRHRQRLLDRFASVIRVSVCAHSRSCISSSTFTEIGTDVRTPKVNTSSLGLNIAPPLSSFAPKIPF